MKYTSTGEISIRVRRHTKKSRSRRTHLRFEVSDTGLGLNLEQQQNCFLVPKMRTNVECKDKSREEEGVGLALCKSLIDAMGGTIGVESKPCQGSTFWFEVSFLRATTGASGTKRLPPKQSKKYRKSDRSVGSRGSLSLDPVPDEGGLQILLVDENSTGRNIMIALLEQSGHRVTTAESSEAMVSAVLQGSYDVVLLETQLIKSTDATVLDAVQEIRSNGYSVASLPILALTSAVPRPNYRELGLNDWLTKPILLKDINAAMINAICNVGAKSVCTGSVCSMESSLCEGEESWKRGNSLVSQEQQRLSVASVHSDFSDQLQAVMGSSGHGSKRPSATWPPFATFTESQHTKHCVLKKCPSDGPPRMLRRVIAPNEDISQAMEVP